MPCASPFAHWMPHGHPPAGEVPEHQFPFFGANPIHTRESEDWDPAVCPKCGGYVAQLSRDDPVRDYDACVTRYGRMVADPMTVVCGACLRSLYDHTPALERAIKPSTGDLDDDSPESAEPPTDSHGRSLVRTAGGNLVPDAEGRDNLRRARMTAPGQAKRKRGGRKVVRGRR